MKQSVMFIRLFYCSYILGSVNSSVPTPDGYSKFHCRCYTEWKRVYC